MIQIHRHPEKCTLPMVAFWMESIYLTPPFWNFPSRSRSYGSTAEASAGGCVGNFEKNAGIAANRLRGSSTGVFVGITVSDYARLAAADRSIAFDAYTATGGALNVAAGCSSFLLGLNGPAVAVDTACSSSLVAVHLACQSLRTRESDLALAGESTCFSYRTASSV